jgi:DegV family protein with EDD domain
MNDSKIAVLIDSGCDLDEKLISRYHIWTVGLKIIYPEKMYTDGIDIQPETVYERFPAEIPKTSTPNSQDVLAVVRKIREAGYDSIIAVTISSGLSGTWSSMCTAFREIEDMKTFVFDSKNISIGAGTFAVWVAQKIEEGMGFEQITEALKKKAEDSKLYYYMDTLDYLAKGGRITPSIAIVGKILHLKPIISCNTDGIYYTVAKIRGSANGIRRLMEIALSAAATASSAGGKLWFSVMYGGNPGESDRAEKTFLASFPDAILIVKKQITASMAIHTGPGLLGISVFRAD